MKATFVWQETRSLARHYDLRVITPIPYVPPMLRSKPKYAYHAVPAVEEREGLTLYCPRYLVTPKMMRAGYGHLMYWGALPVFKRLLREENPDFILAHFAFPDGYAAAMLARRSGLPLLIKSRGSDLNVFTRSRIRRRLTLRGLEQSYRAVVVSEAMKDRLISLGYPGERVLIIPNGVDGARFFARDRNKCRRELGLDPDPFYFVFVGNLYRIKGLETLIEAFGGLGEEALSRARLLIVGGGDVGDDLERQIQREGLGQRVKLVGAVPHEAVPRWIGVCDCLVLPSIMEGYPNVLLEALASERPVIASAVGGITEIVRENRDGFLVRPGDKESLSKAMMRMLSGFTLDLEAMSRFKRSWDDVADEMAALIEEMLSASPSRKPTG